MKLKVCGLKHEQNIKELMQLPIDYVGFIFYKKSPRFVAKHLSFDFLRTIPKHIKKVGVFVNENNYSVFNHIAHYNLDMVQLHGDETPEICAELKPHVKVMKAFQVQDGFDFKQLEKYMNFVDYFLFDSPTENYGGSGKSFNWQVLKKYTHDIPFFLSGGINEEHIEEIKQLNIPQLVAIDINSKFETEPGLKNIEEVKTFITKLNKMTTTKYNVNEQGYYGEYGGAYIPEILFKNVEELKNNYLQIMESDSFKKEFDELLKDYVGRPTPLYYAKNLSAQFKTNIYLKREDLNHTGAHKINNALGQILLAKRLGKKRIIAETGAGQHGVATATACALMGLECIIYMGEIDIERQAPNVARMKLLGATVVPALSGSKTLKDATNEAIRDWINNTESTHYIIGSVVGPHPYPDMVARFQSVISKEMKSQLLQQVGKENPDYVIACVGGGSNAAGAFYHYLNNEDVQLIGVEASGKGIDTGHTAATLTIGKPGIIHGSKTYLMQNEDGQITEPYSISAGLDYPGIGPIHSFLHDVKRAQYMHVTDAEAMDAVVNLTQKEGIIPALESAHALAALHKINFKATDTVVLNLSGRGDKDLTTYINYLNENNHAK